MKTNLEANTNLTNVRNALRRREFAHKDLINVKGEIDEVLKWLSKTDIAPDNYDTYICSDLRDSWQKLGEICDRLERNSKYSKFIYGAKSLLFDSVEAGK